MALSGLVMQCECQPTGPGDAQSPKTRYDHPDEVKVWLVKMLPIVDPEGFFVLTEHSYHGLVVTRPWAL